MKAHTLLYHSTLGWRVIKKRGGGQHLLSEGVDILRRLVPREEYGANASGKLRTT